MSPEEKLGSVLGVKPELLRSLDDFMSKKTGRHEVLQKVSDENDHHIRTALQILGVADEEAEAVRTGLRNAIEHHEKHLLEYLATVPGKDDFDRSAVLARRIARVGKGFFLKRSFGEEILKKNKPENLLTFLGYGTVEELLVKHDVAEIFSALRFIESDKWMHETFEKAYSGFTAADFEEREIEMRVLGPEWKTVAEKFVAKKHHNVSHLKEFGVVFLNPIREDSPGKFLRDFALLLHYFHEIEFYSKLFRHYAPSEHFATQLKALLRGDVKEVSEAKPGEWLIVQRYLFKENPQDPRLFMPRVNPESVHWLRGERDISYIGEQEGSVNLGLWHDLDWVGSLFDHHNTQVVSFDLEDNAMSYVARAEGKTDYFNYHQREAMWTKLFWEYAGGEAEAERLLIENFDKGTVNF